MLYTMEEEYRLLRKQYAELEAKHELYKEGAQLAIKRLTRQIDEMNKAIQKGK